MGSIADLRNRGSALAAVALSALFCPGPAWAQSDEVVQSQPTQDASADQQSSEPAEEEVAPPLTQAEVQETEDESSEATPLLASEAPEVLPRRQQDSPATRWSEAGAFVGMVSRASSSSRFKYRPGIAYGGFFRPQLTDWLGIRLSYREERISVEAKQGAFDWGTEEHELDLSQPDLKVTSLGVRLEPSFHLSQHLHVVGALSWAWARVVAPMPTADGFNQKADRAGVELNWGLGAGLSLDLLRNWLNLSLMGSYHFVSSQTGSAYEDEVQAVVDGQLTRFAPLAPPKNMVDVLLSVGLIL